MQVAFPSAGRSIMTNNDDNGNGNDDHNSQDELERMLQEAERLAAQMRAAATASAAHLASSSSHHGSTSQHGVTTPPLLFVPEGSPPPPPQASPAALLPLTTVQIARPPNDPPNDPPDPHDKRDDDKRDDDVLSLPSQIQIGDSGPPSPDEDETPDALTTRLLLQSKTGRSPPFEMEAALQVTHDMAQALQHALGVAPAVVAASPGSPESPPAATPTPTTTTTRIPATPPAVRPLDPFAVAPAPRERTPQTSSRQVAPRAPPPPAPAVPTEGDDDYAPLKDYSFKPSKWTPDESVQWEQVDLAQEDDADYVALRDYSSPSPQGKSTAVSSLPVRGGRLALAPPRAKRRRRRRRAAVSLILTVLAAAVAYVYYDKNHGAVAQRSGRPTPTTGTPEPPQTIRVQPLPWVVPGDTHDDGDRTAYSFQSVLDEEEDDDYDFTVAEIGHGAAGGACHFPLAWLVAPQCHGRESSPTERVEALLQSMLQ
jgi:hypothetical protein